MAIRSVSQLPFLAPSLAFSQSQAAFDISPSVIANGGGTPALRRICQNAMIVADPIPVTVLATDDA